jgi:hypothetical protein
MFSSLSSKLIPHASRRVNVSQLQLLIQTRLGKRVSDFQLILVDGGWVIRGRSQTYYAKQLAQEAVLEMTDLPIIANSIQVKRTPDHVDINGEPSFELGMLEQ